MLQFTRIFARNSTSSTVLSSIIRYNNYSSSISTPELKNLQTSPVESEVRIRQRTQVLSKAEANIKVHKTMVEAAFASLKSDNAGIKTPSTDNKVAKAETLDELLKISEGNGVSRKHALRVVSILADWSSSGKVNQAEFETDPRFLRLCRVLTKGSISSKNARNSASRSDDLSTILSVTADDEAAKLVGSITLSQMVKVMSTLSQTKRRSTLLLRALAYNITGNSDQLDLKQCSDLLFSMSTLNFLDENLLTRVANDISVELEKNVKKSSVIGSILTSIGLLKYKNPVLLDTLSEWVVKNHYVCRPQDIFSLFMTLGILNYFPINSDQCFEVLLPQLTRSEAGKPLVWLEIVWSLVLLNKANHDQVASILCGEFLESLGENALTISTNLKLLNIDAAAEYQIENYKGPRIAPTSAIRNTKILQAKEKVKMVDAVLVSLKNLIQSENLLRTRINTGHGFLIDAECLLDKKCNPLPLEQVNSNKTATRVAIMAYDYHDMSRGKVEPTGINVLATNLLKAQGYKILTVPYTEFNLRDKLIHRVQYLEMKLKEIVK